MADELETHEENWELKAGEYLAGWKRAQADYANLQKELGTQRTEMGKHALMESVRAFLPVYDYFKRAMQHTPSEAEQSDAVKQWMTGVSHIASLFKMTLQQLGVEELHTLGKPFDPMTMDAMKEIDAENAQPGTVVEEVEGGYKLGEKIIKPARVVVAADKKESN